MIKEKQSYFVEQAKEKVNHHFNHNPGFLKSFDRTIYFYLELLKERINRQVPQDVIESFYIALKSQFFNGYVVGLQLIETQPEEILKEFLSNSNGIIRDQVPLLLREIAKEPLADRYTTDEAHRFLRNMIINYEDVRTPLRQMFVDMLCYGTWICLLDKKGNLTIDIPSPLEDSVFGVTNELHFVTPVHYMMCEEIGTDYEKWELYFWSTYERINTKAGEIIVLCQGESSVRILCYLLEELMEFERYYLILGIEGLLQNHFQNKNRKVSIEVSIIKSFYQYIK
jgi:hypothetical protein